MKKIWYLLSLSIICVFTSSCKFVDKIFDFIDGIEDKDSGKVPSTPTFTPDDIKPGDYLYEEQQKLSVHFIDLDVSGDSILLDYGEYEILIDAGGNKTAGTTIITPYLKQYVGDNRIELAIATHGHEDHIAGFVGQSNKTSVFKEFSFGTIVDTGSGYENLNNKNELTSLQKEYNSLREQKIADGANYYTIRDIFDKELQNWYIAPNFTFRFLKTKFYNIPFEKYTQNLNDYSIATLLEYQNHKFLFTGDLEEEGEKSLTELSYLPEIDVFKAGHHGSKTASSEKLVEIIKPKISIFTADSTNESTYNFPHVEAIERLKKYSNQFYTSYFNGHIVMEMEKTSQEIKINCLENNEQFLVEEYTVAFETIKAISSIGSKISSSSLSSIETAENLYSKLTKQQKKYVYNIQTLIDARQEYESL